MMTEYEQQKLEPESAKEFLSLYRNQVAGRWLTDIEQYEKLSNEKLIEEYQSAEDFETKIKALLELSRRENPELREFFESIVTNSATDQERILALIGLGMVAHEETTEIIIEALRSTENKLLLSVGINILEFFNVAGAEELLVDFLAHEEDRIKFHVARALSHIEEIDDEWLAGQLEQVYKEEKLTDSLKYYLILIIKERPLPEAIPVLERLLDDEDFDVFAIEALGELGSEKAYNLVEPYLNSEDPIHQYYAAEALGKIGSDKCWEQLEELACSSPDSRVRYYSIAALVQINHRESIEILLDRLGDEDSDVRGFASNKLVEQGDVVLKPYRRALEAEEREGVQEALYVLGEIGDVEVIPDLIDKAYTTDKEIEHFAIEALHKVAVRDTAARRALLDILPEANTELKINIIRALAGLGNAALCSYLSRYLKADNVKLRYYIAGVCAGQECPDCLHLLRRLCRDDSPAVAAYAALELTKLESTKARKLAAQLAREEIRPRVLIAYLRGFYLNPASMFERVAADVLQEAADRTIQYFAAAALKSTNPLHLEELAEENSYLREISNKIRVS